MQSFALMEQSVAANTTSTTLLNGTPIQFWGKAGVLTIYANADAVGCTYALTVNDGQTNQQVIPTGSGLGAASTSGKIKTNEDFAGQFAIPAGVQLQLTVTNTTGAAVKSNFLFVIT
jgi:hypothetical protein